MAQKYPILANFWVLNTKMTLKIEKLFGFQNMEGISQAHVAAEGQGGI
jgi:hypothetical protein